jgi:hypothetical protein
VSSTVESEAPPSGRERRLTRRAEWSIGFLLFTALGSIWALTTPIYGASDEPSHALRAASVARAEFVGAERDRVPPSCKQPRALCDYYGGDFRYVRVPVGLVPEEDPGPLGDPRYYVPCFAQRVNEVPTCFASLENRGGLREAATDVGLDRQASMRSSGFLA